MVIAKFFLAFTKMNRRQDISNMPTEVRIMLQLVVCIFGILAVMVYFMFWGVNHDEMRHRAEMAAANIPDTGTPYTCVLIAKNITPDHDGHNIYVLTLKFDNGDPSIQDRNFGPDAYYSYNVGDECIYRKYETKLDTIEHAKN